MGNVLNKYKIYCIRFVFVKLGGIMEIRSTMDGSVREGPFPSQFPHN